MICFRCKKEVEILDGKVGFREDCLHCGASLHVCMNCSFYDRSAYNDCKETSADRVVDKESANFCEFFKPGSGRAGTGMSAADEAKRKLEELFKKT